MERERYGDADFALSRLMSQPNLLPEVERELKVAQAYFQLKQGNNELALGPLNQAIEVSKKNNKKARYAFIVAQIHQQAGRNTEALAAYEQVLKFGPPYEMEFRAKLNKILGQYGSKMIAREDAIKKLERLSKDEKNREYQDQIYFVMAEIALEDNNIAEAIDNLNKALNANGGSQAQRIEIYYKLANLYLDEEDYINAKTNFDAALQFMDKNDERYGRVNRYSNSLTGIAENLAVIELQDSLITLSALSDKELADLASELQQERETARKKQEEDAKNNAVASGPDMRTTSSSSVNRTGTVRSASMALASQPSNFFAYNSKALKRGNREFDKKWGGRTLENDWRRSNKTTFDESSTSVVAIDESTGEGVLLTDNEVNSILRDVPRNEAEIAAANAKVEAALFKVGKLFRDKIDNNNKSVEYLEQLLDRYPNTNNRLEAFYYLYLAYTELGNLSKAKLYESKIVDGFPQSHFAKSLTDPNWAKKTQEEANALMQSYDDAYFAYEKGAYQSAFDQIQTSVEKFGNDNPLLAKFSLLSALCIGSLQGKDGYIVALKDVVAKFPSSDEERRAKEILRLLGEEVGKGLSSKTENDKATEGIIYTKEENQMHYVIIPIPSADEVNINQIKASVSDYNRELHSLEKLRIANVFLGRDISKPLVVVRSFKNASASMKYYEEVTKRKNEFIPELNGDFNIYVISRKNYRQLMRDSGIENYHDFFSKSYIK